MSRIQIRNRQRCYKIDRVSAAVFCAALFREIGARDAVLSMAFVSARDIREINRRYRRQDCATDVLSFNYGGDDISGTPLMGEVVIAPEVAVRNAERYHVHPEKEVRKLMVHGILHLLGYDHEADEGEMQNMQSKLMRRNFFIKAAPIFINVEANS